jgi:hypothetical protein
VASINSPFVNEVNAQRASKGMRIQGIHELMPGGTLYRFVQRADLPTEKLLSSPWWFQSQAVRQILTAARSGHRGEDSVSGQASRMAGLSKTWQSSGAHYLLAAKVIGPLSVLWGTPLPIGTAPGSNRVSGLDGDQATDIEVVPDPRCVQFYAPGMWDRSVYWKTLVVVSCTKFRHSQELADGEVEAFLARVSRG